MVREIKFKPITWMQKEVGQLREDNLVFQTVRLPYHIYHKENSVGISKQVLDKVDVRTEFKLLKIIFILKLGNNKVVNLSVNKDYFKEKSFIVNNPDFDKDEQLHMKIGDLCKLNFIAPIEPPQIYQHEEKYN